MNLQNQVVSLNLAKRMKELGFEQESLFYWCPHFTGSGSPYSPYEFRGDYYLRTWDKKLENAPVNFSDNDFYSAYTVAELGEMLPKKVDGISAKTYKDEQGFWYCVYEDERITAASFTKKHGERIHRDEWAKTEANARAKMLIYLKEQKLI